jgi:hypothetical protein
MFQEGKLGLDIGLPRLPLPREVHWDNPSVEEVIEARMRSPHVFPGSDQFARSVLDKLASVWMR